MEALPVPGSQDRKYSPSFPFLSVAYISQLNGFAYVPFISFEQKGCFGETPRFQALSCTLSGCGRQAAAKERRRPPMPFEKKNFKKSTSVVSVEIFHPEHSFCLWILELFSSHIVGSGNFDAKKLLSKSAAPNRPPKLGQSNLFGYGNFSRYQDIRLRSPTKSDDPHGAVHLNFYCFKHMSCCDWNF